MDSQGDIISCSSARSSPPAGTSDGLPEVWGGIECTVNRVENSYFDQTELTGHSHRLGDLDLLASLGIKAMRYPVLWERVAPGDLANADWSWTDARLHRLCDLGITPIAGLLHHGSGPRHTSLLDTDFPPKLASYAGAVARRYPWVAMYTPVNEPLTTARFSCLYGHWYPHRRESAAFFRALLNQCKGTALAMRAIREVNPGARLVQTEDLGKSYSTSRLSYQADFENERRWLTFDLLCGRVGPEHPLWGDLMRAGIESGELEWLSDNPCPPDVLGVNYYLTSERFLDHNLDRYPQHMHGGNGRDRYVDVEAVRALPGGIAGPSVLMREAWDRYRLPLAVTEVHNGCTREQQLLWLEEIWSAAINLRADGVDLRAVTPWALFGAYDWHNLVTRMEGRYEPGLFDIRSPEPRATALASLVREMAAGEQPSHPALGSDSWWRQPSRLLYVARPAAALRSLTPGSRKAMPKATGGVKPQPQPRPILITGATGTLGTAFGKICEQRGLRRVSLRRGDLDITEADKVAALLDELEPWAVVNAAGYVRVDDAEIEREACYRENALGPAMLAAACAARGVKLVTFTSDLVFDGNKGAPYVESDPVAPLNTYGASKAEAEKLALAAHPGALVVRTSAFFGPWDEHNFVTLLLNALAAGKGFAASESETVSPTYVPDLVNACLDLLIDGETGIWHLANQGVVTWAEFALLAASAAGIAAEGIERQVARPVAARPRYSALASERGALMPPLHDALARYVRDCPLVACEQCGPEIAAERELEMVAAS